MVFIFEPAEPLTMTTSPARMAAATPGLEPGGACGIASTPRRWKSVEQVLHQGAAAEHQVDAARLDRLGERTMQIRAVGAEFQHIAQYRDARPRALTSA